MITFRHLQTAFRRLEIEPGAPVIAHASLSAFGQVQGGADTVVAGLLSAFESVVMPAFTYQTMITPLVGPPDNAVNYGRERFANRQAQLFDANMPADRLMGAVAESLRRHPQAERSFHPILSFTGVHAGPYLQSQTFSEPLAPVGRLSEAGGWVLLMGVDHTANTSLHYAERLAGRKQFLRWAATPHGIRACPGFPGCSDGFGAIEAHLGDSARHARIGAARLQAVPLAQLLPVAAALIAADPLALLCQKDYCPRCAAVRTSVLSSPADR